MKLIIEKVEQRFIKKARKVWKFYEPE